MHELLTERPNLFEPNNQMAFYIEMTKVETEKLKGAIEKAYLNNETTCSKIVLLDDGTAYFKKIEGTCCSVQETSLSYHDVILEEEKKAFKLDEGELVRCFIRQFENKTGLLIYAHHLVGDGKAVMCFINDIGNALIGKELTYQPLNLLTKEDITQTYQLPKKVTLYTKFCNLRWKLLGNKVFTFDDYYKNHEHYWKNHTSNITCYTLSEEETLKFRQLSKAAGVSVNSYLTTAFIKDDPSKHSIGMITSLREKGNCTMANLISGISSTQQYDLKISFNENARKVHQEIQRSLNKYRYFVINFMTAFAPSLVDGILLHSHGIIKNMLLEEISRVTGYKGNFTRDIGITNLTVLDVPSHFGNYEIEKLLVIAPLISYTRKVVCVSTFNGKMTLAYHDMLQDGKGNPEFFESVIKNIKSVLNQ